MKLRTGVVLMVSVAAVAALSSAAPTTAVPREGAAVPSPATPTARADPAPGPVAISAAVTPTAVAPVPIGRIRLVTGTVARGLVNPMLVTSANDGTKRLFVVEQAGRIRTVVGNTVTGTFLDIRSLVLSGGERGLLGLAFAPDFATSHLFWVAYTKGDGALVIARFSTTSATAATATLASRRTVLVIPHPTYGNHNGGYIGFGPDGYLYVGTGDGGGAGDPANNSQNLRSLLGKMLRLDVRCGTAIYCSPPTNPYVRSTWARHEIWLTGLRNPWRWSFDTTGTQWIGDVGQGRYEEIDAVAGRGLGAGRNLGWSCREGKHTYLSSRCRSTISYLAPAVELCHPDSVAGCRASAGGEAVIGGFVYRGPRYAGFQGTYVFGDFVTGRIWPYKNGVLGSPALLSQVSGFGTDRNGEIYAVTLDGRLVRVAFISV